MKKILMLSLIFLFLFSGCDKNVVKYEEEMAKRASNRTNIDNTEKEWIRKDVEEKKKIVRSDLGNLTQEEAKELSQKIKQWEDENLKMFSYAHQYPQNNDSIMDALSKNLFKLEVEVVGNKQKRGRMEDAAAFLDAGEYEKAAIIYEECISKLEIIETILPEKPLEKDTIVGLSRVKRYIRKAKVGLESKKFLEELLLPDLSFENSSELTVDTQFKVINASQDNKDAQLIGVNFGDVLRYELTIKSNTENINNFIPSINVTNILKGAELIDPEEGKLENNHLVYPNFTCQAPCEKMFVFYVRAKPAIDLF